MEKYGQPHCYVEDTTGDDIPSECKPRELAKKDKVILLAPLCLIKALWDKAIVLDVRDPTEIEAEKGGVALDTAISVPINIDGQPQSTRKTTAEEFKEKLTKAGVLPTDRPIISHCTGGGRGQTSTDLLKELGCEAYNGGGPAAVREAIEFMRAKNA